MPKIIDKGWTLLPPDPSRHQLHFVCDCTEKYEKQSNRPKFYSRLTTWFTTYAAGDVVNYEYNFDALTSCWNVMVTLWLGCIEHAAWLLWFAGIGRRRPALGAAVLTTGPIWSSGAALRDVSGLCNFHSIPPSPLFFWSTKLWDPSLYRGIVSSRSLANCTRTG